MPNSPAEPGGSQPDPVGTSAGMGTPPGMGPTPSGPSFAPSAGPPLTGPQLGPVPSAGPDPATYRPRRTRLPAVLTAIVIGVVALVVTVASVLAHRADQRVVADPGPSPAARSPYVAATKDSIEFTSHSGTGRLTIVDHGWRQAETVAGSALDVEVRIVCTGGEVDYDPSDFQVFDATGNLFDLAAEEVRGPLLGAGHLESGQQTSGALAFVVPRGEVTLLMSDDADSVTALKVPD